MVYQGVPEDRLEGLRQYLDHILGGFPTVLGEVQRDLGLPDAARWTEPLLALIAQTRRATRSPGAAGRD